MKRQWFIIFAAILPLSGMANRLTGDNNAPQPRDNPSTQRLQQQMQNQQSQQELKLQQDQQRQQQALQGKIQEHRNSAPRRTLNTPANAPVTKP